MGKGDKVPLYLSEEERYLIGFCINRGSERPRLTASNYNSWNKHKIWIAENLYKIKHWEIIHGSYEEIANIKATWFIDPPYQYGGNRYVCNNKSIDYKKLAEWCKTRNGEVIVCENHKANWLPFGPLKEMYGQRHTTTEMIYYQHNELSLNNIAKQQLTTV